MNKFALRCSLQYFYRSRRCFYQFLLYSTHFQAKSGDACLYTEYCINLDKAKKNRLFHGDFSPISRRPWLIRSKIAIRLQFKVNSIDYYQLRLFYGKRRKINAYNHQTIEKQLLLSAEAITFLAQTIIGLAQTIKRLAKKIHIFALYSLHEIRPSNLSSNFRVHVFYFRKFSSRHRTNGNQTNICLSVGITFEIILIGTIDCLHMFCSVFSLNSARLFFLNFQFNYTIICHTFLSTLHLFRFEMKCSITAKSIVATLNAIQTYLNYHLVRSANNELFDLKFSEVFGETI